MQAAGLADATVCLVGRDRAAVLHKHTKLNNSLVADVVLKVRRSALIIICNPAFHSVVGKCENNLENLSCPFHKVT